MANYLHSNLLVKIRFPNVLSQGHWTIEEKASKAVHAVPLAAVLMTVKCSHPLSEEILLQYIHATTAMEEEQLGSILNYLIEKQIIHISDQNTKMNTGTPFNSIEEWEKAGWGDASHYHFFTWDAPFLDYSKEGGGHEESGARMAEYHRKEPDVERCKRYSQNFGTKTLPSISDLSEKSGAFFKKMTFGERVQCLLSIALGKKGEVSRSWTNTPIMRRTSPSGGSRHPTEGYLLVHNIEGMARGWHHIQADPLELVSISPEHPLDNSILGKQTLYSAGVIILTSCFERNMYRYRHPYAFRVTHMDVGYMLATIETLGGELGIETHTHLSFDEELLLNRIGASLFQEGVIAAITINNI